MKIKTLLTLSLLSTSTLASVYVDLSGGALRKEISGDNGSYKGQNAFTSEVSLGYAWDNFDLSIDANYSIGRQKDFSFSFGGNPTQTDDFNWQSFNVGPTLRYHIKSDESNWSYAPFIGVFYNSSDLSNSAEYLDPATGDHEDNGQELWGYGGKLGLQFKNYRPQSSVLEAINYKVFASYTKYRETEAKYLAGGNVRQYSSDTPDNLEDISVGFMVGVSFGDKLFKKTKQAVSRLANF